MFEDGLAILVAVRRRKMRELLRSNTIIFVAVVLVIFLILLVKSYRQNNKVSNSILGLLMLSIIISIALGINYVVALVGGQDGIAIENKIAYLIIGENRWSVELFRLYFHTSLISNVILFITYIGSLFLQKGFTGGRIREIKF